MAEPDELIRSLGPLTGKTVLDTGSGTGYFSFRPEKSGAHVICGDVDQRFLDLIEIRRKELEIPPERMELRKLPFKSPAMKPGEVDLVLAVNVYHHIENRPACFRQVLRGLRPGGRIVIVDFKSDTGLTGRRPP